MHVHVHVHAPTQVKGGATALLAEAAQVCEGADGSPVIRCPRPSPGLTRCLILN